MKVGTTIRSIAGDGFVLILLILSVGLNFVLLKRLETAKDALAPHAFLNGGIAPSIRLVDSLGHPHNLGYEDAHVPTLLYWYSPSCGWCELNFANFQALARQAGSRYRFFAVSPALPGENRDFAHKKNLDVPLYSISPEAARQYRLNGTPATVLIGTKGELLKRWEGAYSPRTLASLEETLHVSLPGLSPDNSPPTR